MLTITVPDRTLWDEKNEVFVEVKGATIQLEHSLISLSKWESKWHKAFMSGRERTSEENLDYIKCMTLTPNVKDYIYNMLTIDNIKEINNYIDDSMTATYINERKGSGSGGSSGELVTAEVIYYWMIALNIPFECQKWHLNRLITLIKVCNIKNNPPKRMSQREVLANNAALNAARRKKLNTKG